MAKSSSGMKDLLLEKGELFALIGSGGLAFLLLVWGVVSLATAGAPVSATEIDKKADGIKRGITAAGEDAPKAPEWIDKSAGYPEIKTNNYALIGSTFEPIHQPNMLRENPRVLPIDDYQIDLVRAPMPALDIQETGDGKIMIGVLMAKPKGDTTSAQQLSKDLRGALGNYQGRPPTPLRKQPQRPPTGGQPLPPGGGSAGPPPAGGSGGPPPGGGGGMPGMPGGGMPGMPGGGGYDPYGAGNAGGGLTGVRDDKTVAYFSPDDVEKKGLPLAKTVYPLRMLIVHAAVPLNAQRDEIRRALRLPEVKTTANGQTTVAYNPEVEPVFDGIEVDRRLAPPGADIEKSPWSEFDHYAEYYSKIRARKIADEPDSDYLSLFFRYEQKMAAPLPLLADKLGAYGGMRIESINRITDKLIAARKPIPTVSDWNRRFLPGASNGDNPYAPVNTGTYGGATAPGMGDGRPGLGMPLAPGGVPMLPGGTQPYPGNLTGGTAAQAPPTLPEIDHILARFLDPDVKPGFTYQYRVRLRMKNPNFNQKGKVGKDDDAKKEILHSIWVEIPEKKTIPLESFLYAYDANKYLDQVKALSEASGKDPQIAKLLEEKEVREGKRAVIQIQTWMEKVRIDGTGNKSEPVGTWVVAAMPVGPGEYIGRRQLVELPLWSAGIVNYVLRELTGGAKIAGVKDKNQPKGWPVNFRTLSVLVDFDGGKTKTKVNDKDVYDDAAAELLILRADGKMIVRNSADDMDEEARAKRNKDWDDWLARVKLRKDLDPAPAGTGTEGGFTRPGGGGTRPGGGN